MERDRPQHKRSAVCVIAQQDSPATFILLQFYLRKENAARFSPMLLFQFIFLHFLKCLLNCVSLKFRNLELRESESVCSNNLPKHSVCIFLNIQRG